MPTAQPGRRFLSRCYRRYCAIFHGSRHIFGGRDRLPTFLGVPSRFLRPRTLRAVAAGLITLSIAGCASPPQRIILIVVDTLRADHLSCYGSSVATPTFDRLSESGAKNSNAVGSFHQTTMSMGGLFMGLTPSLESGHSEHPLAWHGSNWCGMARFPGRTPASRCLPTSYPTLAERLRAAGYRTVGITSNELLFHPAGFDRGFDVWHEVGKLPPYDKNTMFLAGYSRRVQKARSAERVRALAIDALQPHLEKRLFLYVHFMDVHDWYTPGDPNRGYDRADNYARGVAAFDEQLAAFVASLEELGLMKNAVVIVTADHGEALGEPHPIAGTHTHDGNPSYQTVLRVPLIVSPARKEIPSDGRLVRSEDVHRAIAAMAGAASTTESSLRDDEHFVSERRFQTYREGRWKFLRARSGEPVALFDLENDPTETVNIVATQSNLAERFDRRIDELGRTLAATAHGEDELSEQDKNRLRALGYLE